MRFDHFLRNESSTVFPIGGRLVQDVVNHESAVGLIS